MDFTINIAGLTHIGKVREENQDAFLIDKEAGIMIIADGMGGLKNGKKTAEKVVRDLMAKTKIELPGKDSLFTNNFISGLRKQISAISREIGIQFDDESGSTLVMGIVRGNSILIANVGDSPAFLLRNNEWICLTKDHNVAGLLVDQGKITKEEARSHHLRHQLVAFMGQRSGMLIHTRVEEIKAGDRILLCTDGLTGMVKETEIIQTLQEDLPLEEISRVLVEKANFAGGKDNITVVISEIK